MGRWQIFEVGSGNGEGGKERRWEDEKIGRWEDEKVGRWEDEKIGRWEGGNDWKSEVGMRNAEKEAGKLGG